MVIYDGYIEIYILAFVLVLNFASFRTCFFSDLIYHATESSSSAEGSPIARRKTDPKKKHSEAHFDPVHGCQIQESSLTFPQKRERGVPPFDNVIRKGKHYYKKGAFPPVSFKQGPPSEVSNKQSQIRGEGKTKVPSGIARNLSSHFRNYSQNKSKEDYSIKV